MTGPQQDVAADAREQAPEDTAVRRIARRDSGTRSTLGRGASRSPSGFELTVRLNGVARLVPVVADSLERLVPLAEALELADGGFDGRIARAAQPALCITLNGLVDARAARQRVEARKAELLGGLLDGLPREQRRRQFGLALDVLGTDAAALVVALRADAPDGSGAELHELAPSARAALADLVRAEAHAEARELVFERVRVGCTLDPRQLVDAALRSSDVRLAASVQRGLRYLEFALGSPRTAAVQNHAVLCAISRVALALGHDPRPVLSVGHAHAARFGGCASVVAFAQQGARLRAELELPLPLEPHGRQGSPEAAAAQTLSHVEDGDERRLLAACVGLASQLPALRAAILQ
jgi:hypothetical protein